MKVQEIREIIKLINQTTIHEFEFEQEGTKIKIIKSTGLENSIQPTDIPVLASPAVQSAPVVQSVSRQEVQSESIEEKPQDAEEKTEQPTDHHKITSPMV